MAPLLGLPRILRAHGLDADTVIRESGCNPALFADPENTIDFAAVGRLLVHTAEVTGTLYPGLELGRQWSLDVFGALGKVLRFAPDVGTALRAMIRHFHLHDRGAVPSLWECGSETMLGYTLYSPGVSGTDHIYDAALAIAYNVLAELAGNGWEATEVRFFRDSPTNKLPFREHFRTRLRFGQMQAAIVFPTTDLMRPLAAADPNAYRRAVEDMETLDASSDTHLFSCRVRRLLRRLFISGSDLEAIDLNLLAHHLALHPRTLARRLHDEKTGFSDLLAEVRYEIAQQLLRDTHMQIADIAATLGYSNSASFDHAFRRWSGITATAWRSSEQ